MYASLICSSRQHTRINLQTASSRRVTDTHRRRCHCYCIPVAAYEVLVDPALVVTKAADRKADREDARLESDRGWVWQGSIVQRVQDDDASTLRRCRVDESGRAVKVGARAEAGAMAGSGSG